MGRKKGKAGKGRRLPLLDRPGVNAMFDNEKASVVGRSCGSCRACCTVHKLRLDGPEGPNTVTKPRHTPCPNLLKKVPGKRGGCGIYLERPTDCVIYKCYWLEGFGEKRDRPDRLGMIVDTSDGVCGGIYALSGIRTVVVHETHPGANRNPRFRAAIVGIVRRGLAIIYHGTGKKLEPTMVKTELRAKLDTAMRALGIASDLTEAHVAGAHTEPVSGCPVCAGICPAHHDEPSPICPVCRHVAEAKKEQQEVAP